MKLNSYILAALVLVIIFGGIAFSSAMNWWTTENVKTPAKYSDAGLSGTYDPADIRASYTFGEISEYFDIPLTDLAVAFRVPAGTDAADTKIKDLETLGEDLLYEVGTSSVRMFVAFYNGLPYDLVTSEESYLYPEAAAILTANGKMLPEQAAYLETHIVPEDGAGVTESSPAPNMALDATPVAEVTAEATEHLEPERTVTGSTTFQDVLDWGVPQETIETILGAAMPPAQTLVKDYATEQGLGFSNIKTALQAAVDSLE